MFLAIVGAIVALLFSSWYLDIRSQWMAKAQKLEQEYTENIEKVQNSRAKLAAKQKEVTRTMLAWDRYWTKINGSVSDAGKGQVTLDIGTNRGLQDKQVVYVFELDADGKSNYYGAFRVATAREDRCSLEPIWRMRPGDVPEKGTSWRIRTMIPAHYGTRISDLEAQFLIADEDLRIQEGELKRQQEAITVAQEHLELRLGEINGVKELEGKPLPAEVIKGLLSVMVEEEEVRNKALAAVDDLLRKLKVANERFERIRRENSQLAGSLPQPAAATEAGKEAGVDLTNR